MGSIAPISQELHELKKDFASWRAETPGRGGRKRIPESLWSRAIELARKEPPTRVSRACGLDVEYIRKRMAPAPVPVTENPFLELPWPVNSTEEVLAEVRVGDKTVRFFSGLSRRLAPEILIRLILGSA